MTPASGKPEICCTPLASPALSKGRREVSVLLATRNGAAFLPAQLESIAAQTGVSWQLLVSDDGSTDGTRTILQDFSRAHPPGRVTILDGPQQGLVQNFRHLLSQAPAGAILALADQDDIWLPDKLHRACELLSRGPDDIPALYGSRVMISDAAARPRHPSAMPRKAPAFRNAVVQNIYQGNTIVVNARAAALLQTAEQLLKQRGDEYVLHDWWVYIMIAASGGRLIFDDRPGLLYRQHENNVIGANTGLRASIVRMRAVMGGRNSNWLDQHLRALDTVRDLITPDARDVIASISSARRAPLVKRVAEFRRIQLFTQRRRAQLGLWLAILLRRL